MSIDGMTERTGLGFPANPALHADGFLAKRGQMKAADDPDNSDDVTVPPENVEADDVADDPNDPTVVSAAARGRGVNDYFMDEGSFSDED